MSARSHDLLKIEFRVRECSPCKSFQWKKILWKIRELKGYHWTYKVQNKVGKLFLKIVKSWLNTTSTTELVNSETKHWLTFKASKQQTKQEVGNDLGACMLNLSSKSTPWLVYWSICLVKTEALIFQIITWPHVADVIKGWEPLWCPWVFYKLDIMYLICFSWRHKTTLLRGLLNL